MTLQGGTSGSAVDAVERAFDAIALDGRMGIWISHVPRRAALAEAERIDAARTADPASVPLAGLVFAVKDNIDVAGIPTTAACPSFAYTPAEHAPAVQALVDAGAVVIGKTNLDQFATGLVGTRSPYGICPNAHWPNLVSGGSSSGSAVAVAAGHVDFALGTDTAGSGRIPAACNGIVGIKPTRGRVSAHGVVPACRSLDCVTVFARGVELAASVAGIMARTTPDPADPWSRAAPIGGVVRSDSPRLGIAKLDAAGFDGDAAGAHRFSLAAAAVAAHASSLEPYHVDVTNFVATGALLYEGAFVAERYEAVGAFVDAHAADVDPVVAGIVQNAARLPAWQVFRDRTRLAELAARTAPLWDEVDVLVVPSAPRIPTVKDVLGAPIERNTMLGRYTNFVNLLDLCALTLPVPTEHDLATMPPTSVTLIAPAWHDDVLVSLAARVLGDTPTTRRTT